MTYRLYSNDGSGSGIVEMALATLGVPYELSNVSFRQGDQNSAEYARLNPQRKVPTLVTPAGEVLTESAAILLVLDERYPEAKLFPPFATPERAQAQRWLLFMASELYPIIEINDFPERFAPSAESAPAVKEVAKRIWRQRWSPVEQAIASPWFLPSGFSFCDVYLAVLSRWSLGADWRREHLPKVESIAQAVAQREPLAPIWQRHHGPRTP